MKPRPVKLPPEVLSLLGVQPAGFLGGRLNQHWRVTRARETLVLRRWHDAAHVSYEQAVRSRVAALGWPVPLDVAEPVTWDAYTWSLMTFLPGVPPPDRNSAAEQRQRGRLLAEFHLSTSDLTMPARPGWRRAPEILNDPELERLFQTHGQAWAHLWHLARARELAAAAD